MTPTKWSHATDAQVVPSSWRTTPQAVDAGNRTQRGVEQRRADMSALQRMRCRRYGVSYCAAATQQSARSARVGFDRSAQLATASRTPSFRPSRALVDPYETWLWDGRAATVRCVASGRGRHSRAGMGRAELAETPAQATRRTAAIDLRRVVAIRVARGGDDDNAEPDSDGEPRQRERSAR